MGHFSDLPAASAGHHTHPRNIAESYVYLAKNGFTTGTVVLIDGGAHLVLDS